MKRFLFTCWLAGAASFPGYGAELKVGFGGSFPAEPWRLMPKVEAEAETSRGGKPGIRFLGDVRYGAFELPLNTEVGEPFAGAIKTLTIAFWLKVPEEPANGFSFVQRAHGGGSGASGYYHFSLHPRLGLRFVTKGQKPVSTRRQLFRLEPGEWTHLAMVYDKGVVTFYRNGERLPVQGETGGEEIAPLEPVDAKAQVRFLISPPPGTSIAELFFSQGEALDEEAIRNLGHSAAPAAGD